MKRVVSASSAAVYGMPEDLPLQETSPLAPISPYAVSKWEMEKLHREFYEKHGLESVCLRFFNVYGPRQNPKSPYSGVISKFIGTFQKSPNANLM